MNGYRIISVFGLVFSVMSAFVLIMAVLFSFVEENRHVLIRDIGYGYRTTPIQALIKAFIIIVVAVYIFICINSLYFEIKEKSTQTQIPTQNILIRHHQQQQQQYQEQHRQPQPVRIENECNQSPPSYNEAMQQLQLGCQTQVVIPLYHGVSSFKPQAV